MTSPLPTLFGRHQTKQLDLDRPEGCDHDQNVYHYRLVAGDMVLRGIVLGHGWEHRPMSWTTLSCYKQRGDMQMALITKESGRPEARADKAEILTNAKKLMDGGQSLSETARILDVPLSTLHSWISKERKNAEKADKYRAGIESVDAGKPVTNYGGPVDLINLTIDDCHKITKRLFGDRLTENKDGTVNIGPPVRSMGCIEPELSDKATEVVTAPIGVEVPQYEPEDNDFNDEPIPYVVKPDPLDAQIDIMLDLLWAEKRAKLKAHLKPLLSDAEAWDMVKCIIARGLA